MKEMSYDEKYALFMISKESTPSYSDPYEFTRNIQKVSMYEMVNTSYSSNTTPIAKVNEDVCQRKGY